MANGENESERTVSRISKEGMQKVMEPDDILVEAWRCLGKYAVDFMTSFLTEFYKWIGCLRNRERQFDPYLREQWRCTIAAVVSWLALSTRVRQSEGSGFKSRSGQIAYFHGVKTRLSTLGTGDVPRGSDST